MSNEMDMAERLRAYLPYNFNGEFFGPKVCEEAAVYIERLQSELTAAKEALEVARGAAVHVMASLEAAVSILQRAHVERKEPRRVVASDRMFLQMIEDYNRSLADARSTLSTIGGGK